MIVSELTPAQFKTYKEWNAIGRRINRGAKAASFRNGEPLFGLLQTYNPTREPTLQYNYRGITGEWDDAPH